MNIKPSKKATSEIDDVKENAQKGFAYSKVTCQPNTAIYFETYLGVKNLESILK